MTNELFANAVSGYTTEHYSEMIEQQKKINDRYICNLFGNVCVKNNYPINCCENNLFYSNLENLAIVWGINSKEFTSKQKIKMY